MVLANEIYVCSGVDPHLKGCKDHILRPITSTMLAWLLIETFCFYCYMLATIVFIAWRMIASELRSNVGSVSDMAKAMNDFITYSSINLTWLSFNFVLCTLPPLCIFLIKGVAPDLVKQDQENSYASLMYVLWILHIINFVFSLQIYKTKRNTARTNADEESFVNATSINERFAIN